MSNPTQNLDQLLLEARLAIEAPLADADVLNQLTGFGFNQEWFTSTKALYDEVVALVEEQRIKYGEQYAATQDLADAWDSAKEVYVDALQVARVAFKKDQKAHASLKLSGGRKRSLSGWLGQATSFYSNLLKQPDLVTVMTRFGYDAGKLEAQRALVESVVETKVTQDIERGEAQEATKRRDAKLDELLDLMSDLKAIAPIALKNNPQWLEKMGFKSPS